MTAEYLLEAMGLIDDGLIQDAEVRPAARPAPVRWQRWGALAACLAVVVALGYGVAHLPMGGSSSAATASSAACGAADMESGEINSPAAGTGESAAVADASIFTDQGEYRLTGEVTEVLPEGARELAPLSGLYPDAPFPATDREEYVGCPLFVSPDGTLYLQLPEGGYAAAELAEP